MSKLIVLNSRTTPPIVKGLCTHIEDDVAEAAGSNERALHEQDKLSVGVQDGEVREDDRKVLLDVAHHVTRRCLDRHILDAEGETHACCGHERVYTPSEKQRTYTIRSMTVCA